MYVRTSTFLPVSRIGYGLSHLHGHRYVFQVCSLPGTYQGTVCVLWYLYKGTIVHTTVLDMYWVLGSVSYIHSQVLCATW